MAYTDIRERGLQDHLTIEMGHSLSEDDLRRATGMSSRQWRKRSAASDFPSRAELEAVASYFDLDYINLLAEFGHAPAIMSRRVQALMTAQELPPL